MRKLLIFLCSVLVIMPNLVCITAQTAYNSELVSYAPEIFYLANTDTDTAVFSKNADTACAPASFAKITTAILALEFCEDLDEKVTVSRNAIQLLFGTGSSVAGLAADEEVKMRDLLYCLLLSSSNDAANAIAEHIAKDIPTFVNLMNDFAAAIGCKNTNFVNAHGLDAEGQRTTASDMYLILKHALEIPMFKEITAEYGHTVAKTNKSAARSVYNRNPLINSYSVYYYKYSGGGITGATKLSGECLASFAQKDGYTYICITMKGAYEHINKSADKLNTSYIASRKMYQWAFENMKLKIVADTSRIVDEIAVKYGSDADYVALVPEKEITALVPVSVRPEGLSIVTDASSKPESVTAPVTKGQIIAKAKIYYSNEAVAEVNLVAASDVARSGKKAVVLGLKTFFLSKPFYAVLAVLAAGVILLAVLAYVSGKRRKKKRKTGKRSSGLYTDFKK